MHVEALKKDNNKVEEEIQFCLWMLTSRLRIFGLFEIRLIFRCAPAQKTSTQSCIFNFDSQVAIYNVNFVHQKIP